ncbi:MAG TPA: YceI family protein [Flavobacterium sp.]|uniref:YceI family protein n=1 Tax=Flavobacterium sp. TaxID=239 RepID=UPI002DBBF2A0|nr:YceI family protein [Flavobacterium sp.]HEU4791877.1 YceI family protein [Flavobacterium sp.]
MHRLSIMVMGLVLSFLLGSAKPISSLIDPNTIIIDRLEIEILGNSTVGKYSCSNSLSYRDTIYLNSNTKNSLKSEISMNNFECGNRIMNKDVKTTVKATKFPKSTVTITNIKSFGTNYKCSLNFRITDKTLSYQNMILKTTKESLEGSVAVNFSDIALEPPTKMGGIIKVKDEFVIHFNLYKL